MNVNKNTVFHIPAESGIGDALQYSRHGEFFQREYGCKIKLNYTDKWGIYADNPYVEKVDTNNWDLNLWGLNFPMKMGSPVYQNLSKLFDMSGWHDDVKPSLYLDKVKHFDIPVIAISTDGAHTHHEQGHTRSISTPIVDMLFDQLKYDFDIIQVGGPDDYKIDGAYDMRGWSIKNTHEYLTGCDLFIGVNSGMMHVAACIWGLPLFIYTNVGVTDPPWDNPKAPTHDWFYRSAKYIGPKGKENVIPVMEFIERVKNDN